MFGQRAGFGVLEVVLKKAYFKTQEGKGSAGKLNPIYQKMFHYFVICLFCLEVQIKTFSEKNVSVFSVLEIRKIFSQNKLICSIFRPGFGCSADSKLLFSHFCKIWMQNQRKMRQKWSFYLFPKCWQEKLLLFESRKPVFSSFERVLDPHFCVNQQLGIISKMPFLPHFTLILH